jgi:hypothetical protein
MLLVLPAARTPPGVTLEQIDGVWWLVDAGGERFVSVGINHLEPGMYLETANRGHTLARFGDDLVTPAGEFNYSGEAAQQWWAEVRGQLHEFGINSIGFHTYGLPDRWVSNDFFHFARLRVGRPLVPDPADDGATTAERYDLFGDAFWRELDEQVARQARRHRESEKLLGYMLVDYPRWLTPDELVLHPLVEQLRRLPADAPGKRAWVDVLRDRHPDAATAAAVYNVAAVTWNQLAQRTRWPDAPADPVAVAADGEAFLRVAAERYYGRLRAIIRSHDPHRLVFARLYLMREGDGWFLPIKGKHSDAIAVEAYPRFEQQLPLLEAVHAATGRPILNADAGFAAPDPERQRHGVKGTQVASRAEAGAAYAEALEGSMRLPYMLGYHWCGFIAQWDDPHRTQAINENGLVDPFGQPYPALVGPFREANAKAAEWHANATATQRSQDP